MKTQLLIASLAAALVAGSVTASELPFPRLIDDQDAAEHNVGALDSNITVVSASDVRF